MVNAQQLPVLRNVLPLLDRCVRGQASAPRNVYDRLGELVGSLGRLGVILRSLAI